MKRILSMLRLKMNLVKAEPIEGSMQNHLYGFEPKATPREFSERELALSGTFERNVAGRSRKSTNAYMSGGEVTTLLIASKSGDILR